MLLFLTYLSNSQSTQPFNTSAYRGHQAVSERPSAAAPEPPAPSDTGLLQEQPRPGAAPDLRRGRHLPLGHYTVTIRSLLGHDPITGPAPDHGHGAGTLRSGGVKSAELAVTSRTGPPSL